MGLVEEGAAAHAASNPAATAFASVHPSWHDCLRPQWPHIRKAMSQALAAAEAGARILPAPESVFAAFSTPRDAVRVLIVGQDPYPTPGHPIGLSFAVAKDVRPLPRSLVNIYKELHTDVGCEPVEHGDLTAWQQQGVMLLNRCLTVSAGQPGSHSGWGWEEVTAAAISALASRDTPLVAILWGAKAGQLAGHFAEHHVITSAHPSPLSAHRGFFGSRPFSRCNDLLISQGAEPINWQIPSIG